MFVSRAFPAMIGYRCDPPLTLGGAFSDGVFGVADSPTSVRFVALRSVVIRRVSAGGFRFRCDSAFASRMTRFVD